MAYKNAGKVQEFVKSLGLKAGETYRGDCPSCGGHNRFSATNKGNGTEWYCFGANCRIKGKSSSYVTPQTSTRTRKEIMKLKFAHISNHNPVGQNLLLPWRDDKLAIDTMGYLWKSIERFDEHWEWLDRYNCSDAFDNDPRKFMYDPIQNRIVFIEFSGEYSKKVKLATGRSLDGQEPKWFKYEIEGGVFTASYKNHNQIRDMFICEDAPSACSLSRFGDSVALLGTSWDKKQLIEAIKMFTSPLVKHVFICLDQDANRLALKLQKDISSDLKITTRVLMLSDDAKNLSREQLVRQIPKD